MVLSETAKLGQTIGNLSKSQDRIEQNISPEDTLGITGLIFNEGINLNGVITVYKRRMNGVFIVENDIYGEVGLYPIGPICILDHEEWGILDDCILGDIDVDQYERTVLYTTTL